MEQENRTPERLAVFEKAKEKFLLDLDLAK